MNTINTFLDLCSGIGGGRLGLEQIGLKCIGYSDTSKLSTKTYNLMHDATDEKYFYNLKRIKHEQLPAYDMLIAGFPCQTFSVIGRKDGFSDDRGQIIFHIARILEESKPKCFLLENVKGLVTHDKGKTLQIILDELNRVGYTVDYKVLTSLDYGVPQMRQRVYFVGIRKDIASDLKDFAWPEPVEKPSLSNYLIDDSVASDERLEILKYYLKNPTNNGMYTIEDLKNMEGKILDTRMNDLRIYDGKCPTLRSQRDGVLYVKNHTIYQLTGYEALLLQGFPKEYADKVKNEVSDRHLLMQAGNAMTVSVINKIGQSIKNFLENRRYKTMAVWEDFELACTDYLNEKIGEYATFVHQGGADSTVPDILVKTKSGKEFYIDAKHSPAQCGQFVLLPNIETQSFDYSPKNVNRINVYAQKIMKHMDQDFDEFREAGTAGKDIQMENDSQIFSDWIIQIYKEKGAKYFITNNFVILPIEHFQEYFDVTAKYRIKRSGSGNVGKSRLEPVIDYIATTDYVINSSRIDGDKLFVQSSQQLHDRRFIFQQYEYMFSQRGDEYEVRKLSNTYNANVIFSITQLEKKYGLTDNEFIEILK